MSHFCPSCRYLIGIDTRCPTCDPDCRRSSELPQSTSRLGKVMTRRAELLAIRIAKAQNKPAVFLTVRIGTLSKRATNLALTSSQAKRLLIDLTQVFADAELLAAAGPLDHESRAAFDRIMDDTETNDSRSEEAR